MKKSLLVSVAGLLLVTATNTAQAGDPSWYVSVMAGLTSVEDASPDNYESILPYEVSKGQDWSRKTEAGFQPEASYIYSEDDKLNRIDIEAANSFTIALGRKITDSIRAEMQLSRRIGDHAAGKDSFKYTRQTDDTTGSETKEPDVSLDRDITISAFSLVGYHDLWAKYDLSSYLLAGIGTAQIREVLSHQYLFSGYWMDKGQDEIIHVIISESRQAFIGQVGIGLSYAISDSVSFFGDYRYLAVEDFSFNEVNLGLSYNF